MELQEEEREVIMSIYECDPAFNQKSPVTYQYKFGEDGDPKSFLIEICWGKEYPNEVPKVNMNTFYNNHINEASKERVCSFVREEAEKLLGTPMTYSLFEVVKESFTDLIDETAAAASEENDAESSEEDDDEDAGFDEPTTSQKKKKSQLTKAQKRKQWDRVDCHGERARGWNWIDVIHHLSQTGNKKGGGGSVAAVAEQPPLVTGGGNPT